MTDFRFTRVVVIGRPKTLNSNLITRCSYKIGLISETLITHTKQKKTLIGKWTWLQICHIYVSLFTSINWYFFIFRCYFETGLEFQYDIVPTPEMLAKMLEKSPIMHVKKVRR